MMTRRALGKYRMEKRERYQGNRRQIRSKARDIQKVISETSKCPEDQVT